MSLVSLLFGTGIILALLKSLGKHPELRDMLKTIESSSAIKGAAIFNNLGCKLSRPTVLLTSIFPSSLFTNSESMLLNLNVDSTLDNVCIQGIKTLFVKRGMSFSCTNKHFIEWLCNFYLIWSHMSFCVNIWINWNLFHLGIICLKVIWSRIRGCTEGCIW